MTSPRTEERPVRVAILGSTGSIGRQALEVVDANPGRFEVTALAGGTNAELLAEQAARHRVPAVAMADRAAAAALRADAPRGVTVRDGDDAVIELAREPADVVLNGITGAAGLEATLAALDGGNLLALANKESLIVGGPLVVEAAHRAAAYGGTGSGTRAANPVLSGLAIPRVLPVDSEHSALAQCLRGTAPGEVARLVITASGGPFRGRDRTDLAGVTAAEALRHPTWDMGALITVNSASLANKGLEIIEAHLLFGIPYDRIDVVVHPQSIVHGMVEMVDGSTIAKLSPPDMRLPIQLALGAPTRLPTAPARMDWTEATSLSFEPVDAATFPMAELAVAAGRLGGSAPAVYNAANEEAVHAFLRGQASFLGIADTVAAVLEAHDGDAPHGGAAATDVGTVLAADRWARARARERLQARTP